MYISPKEEYFRGEIIHHERLFLFRFPLTNDFLNRKGIVATRRENFQPTANHLRCSLHFEENCYLENYVNRRQLKDDAIPTVFGFPAHLKKVTKARPRNVGTAENVSVDVHLSGYTGDHNYSIPSSPSKVKEKFEKTEERKEAKIVRYKTKLNTVNKKCKRQTQKVFKLENILEELKVKNLVNDKVISFINATDNDMLVEMAITMLYVVNVSVLAVTCDGLSTNIAMARELSANIIVLSATLKVSCNYLMQITRCKLTPPCHERALHS
ncbi:THAP domain-containing protein 1-like [Schistocerca cancellata]|uniref:THAP domain-containing protein 1-like n=1 Tax=Schistocerca cancellata TaxID=274614 RepID=UPI0021177EFF|nr:THAP domain-containing protein 1-like [Schistocerca cancellata]